MSKRHVIGLCAGNSTVTGEYPAQMASNVENVSIWWRNHGDMSNLVVSIVPAADGLVSFGVWTSISTVMTKSWTFQALN